MKKISILSLMLLLISVFVYAQESDSEVSMEPEKKISQSFTGIVITDTGKGFEPYELGLGASYGIWNDSFDAIVALKLAVGDLQLSTRGIYYPLNFDKNKIKLGCGLTYNLTAYLPYSITNNIIPSVFFSWQPVPNYRLSFDIGYFLKLRSVFAVAEKTPVILNSTGALALKNEFFFPNGFSAYINLSSYELFRYMILCAPSASFGVTYWNGQHLHLTLEATARFTDFFTVSAYYDSTEVKFLVRYEF